MNKRFLLLAAVLAFSLPVLHADIGENFAKGGVGLSGGGNIYIDFNQILNSADEYSRWYVTIRPSVDFFVRDRLSLYISPWFYFEREAADPDNVDKHIQLGADAGLSYAFLMNPAAQRGLVPLLGAGLGIAIYPGYYGLSGGVEYENKDTDTYLYLIIPLRLLFFVNDRVAPYVGASPRIWYWLSAKDFAGNSYTPPSEARLYLELTFSFGISFHIPNAKASILTPSGAR
jgi:hypothetical protein